MKSKFLTTIAISAVAGLMSSCDMDLAPVGTLDQDNAIQSTNDARSFRNNFYTGIRALSSSQFYTLAEIQADCFNGLIINGNRMGTLANGTVLSSDSDIEGYWSSIYGLIANCNFFIQTVEPLYEQAVEENNEADCTEYALYLAEAHFFRGYYYAVMFDRWCEKYDASKADSMYGLPIVTEYNPTADRSKYQGRSTMTELVKFINDEIEIGYNGLREYEELDDSNLTPMAPYISSMAIAAMQARMALWTADYDLAISKADEVINSGIYTLSDTNEKSSNYFGTMWTSDQSNEIIFLPYESTQELSNAIGGAWLGQYTTQADYIPSSELISELEEGYKALAGAKDVRYTTYLQGRNLATSYGDYGTPCFVKFPGNPSLQTTSTNNLVNKPKTFRLAELYLIKAEAAYNNNDLPTANSTLKILWDKRHANIDYVESTGNSFINELIRQRTLELVGEGFRLSDLRRWNLGFTRTYDYANLQLKGLPVETTNLAIAKDKLTDILTPAGLEVQYSSGDHRYTWPIPSGEMDVNPQIKDQQNPGY